ncbi:putative impact protein [Rosellinia necatrix]|uniref:Putative impact protein n=1 Tax=Rosellinia necatrix TaxID=77044 RepID=A0A1W2TRZ7_ROSNE|nr:putative impact protein [Rosellinia necatrix]
MSAQQDLQDLIRLMTVGMKVPMKDALSRVKSLQVKNLRSIQQIAECPLSDVQSALPDAKVARSLHNACKARMKNPSVPSTSKRPGSDLPGDTKRLRPSGDTGYLDGPDPLKPREYEASLELPVEMDEEVIANTTLITNRAPLVLAFAVELLSYTMPEQPPSSRLSLAQAVVSANSRSKAVSIGLEKGLSADDEGWGHGQPRVRVMGREVTVLKRGGYAWKDDEEGMRAGNPGEPSKSSTSGVESLGRTAPDVTKQGDGDTVGYAARSWSTSQPVTLKQSTFIVRATTLTELSKRQSVLQSLFTAIPSLHSATHNAWAYRTRVPTNLFNATTVKEESFDDGESGCGAFLLKSMQEMNAVDVLVVMTRWYGGIMLGPDRWRIMRNCLRDALSERLRITGERATLGGEALWGLDLEAMKNNAGAAGSALSRSYEAGVVGMPIHRPEAAKAYLFKSFATRIDTPPKKGESEPSNPELAGTPRTTPKRKTLRTAELEKQENVARLLGAIRMLYDSWVGHLSVAELDQRAWNWYVAVRPEVESGPSGWGAKGHLNLSDILKLRRKET